jgi:signal transduction histidine kinase
MSPPAMPSAPPLDRRSTPARPITARRLIGGDAPERHLVRRWWTRTRSLRPRIVASYVVLLSLWSLFSIVGEVRENGELLTYGIAVTFFLLALASAGAWLCAGRVAAPVRQLSDTARSHCDFVRDASHELRNPLTISRGHLELLGEDPEERRQTLAIVVDELDRMSRIVDDLQVLTEAERPDFLEHELVDLETFARALATKASALGTRNWQLDASQADGTVVADRHRLTEATLNLAHNAVAHTVRDDTIVIGAAAEANEVRLWVQDTGPGIAEDVQRRIFDRFVRGPTANRRYRGSGLGLAIVKTIAEAHGGTVRVDSRLGAGSRFTIALPRNAPEEGS